MNHTEFLFDEYRKEQRNPEYCAINGKNILIPSSYQGDEGRFIDDWFSFQDNEYRKYDSYNCLFPSKAIEIPEPIKIEGVYIQKPLRHALKSLSDQESVRRVMNTAFRKYKSAIRKTARAQREYPEQSFSVTLNPEELKRLDRLHARYCLKKLGRGVEKTFKISARETANILAGAVGALPAAAYYLLDKKIHFPENRTKRFINEKALPYIRRGSVKALLPLGVFAAVELTPVVGEIRQNRIEQKELRAAEQAEKEAFFAKHNTDSEVFYKNYKQAKSQESEFLCLLACYEDYHDKAYLCQAGELTIGYGSRYLADGRPVRRGMTINREQAAEAVARHMEKYVYPQFRHIDRELTPEQLLAVSMFIYNTDEGAFKDSKVCKAVNAGLSDEKVCEAFSYYRSVNGKRSYGLINRRGFESLVYRSRSVADILTLSPNIAGSSKIRYYEYSADNRRDPIENSDGTFVVRDIDKVYGDLQKFKVSFIQKSILGKLPEDVSRSLIKKYQIAEQNGRLSYLQTPEKTIAFEKGIALAQASR